MSRLIVKNLPSSLDEKELKKKFAEFGKITDCRLMKNEKGKSRRFGFIGYKSEKNATNALEKLNNSLILNQKVCVEMCKNFNAELNKKNKKEKSVEKEEQGNHKTKQIVNVPDGFWVRMAGCPFKVTESNIQEFFFPLQVKNIEILKNNKGDKTGVVLAEFVDEKDQKEALKSNKDYMQGRYIIVQTYQHNMKKNMSLAKKLNKKKIEYDDVDEDISESGRLFVRNLAYTCTEDDLKALFEKFGLLNEWKIVYDEQTEQSLGYGHITYVIAENAIQAFNSLNGSIFQGRMLHVLPSKPKPESKGTEHEPKYQTNTSSFKLQKDAELKKNAENSYNWNTLFVGSNAVADAIVEKFGADKKDVLDASREHSAAVRLALGETQIVQETRQFLTDNKISLDAFNNPNTPRSNNVIIAKNLPASTTSGELRNLFDKFGKIKKVLLAPAGTTAVIEFSKSSDAKNAFTKSAYRSFHHNMLYLEWAPSDIFKSDEEAEVTPQSEEHVAQPAPTGETMTIFVKNLNFDTKTEDMKAHFEQVGPVLNCVISQKMNMAKKEMLSMGFGFVEFKDKKDGLECLKKLQGSLLDDHNLELKRSEKKLSQGNARSNRKAVNQENSEEVHKILVRNIAFQANKQEIRSLFECFGELKAVRLPSKLNPTLNSGGQHRGFAFVEFTSRECAEKAFSAMCHSTHLYGKRLNLEWAKTENTSAEELRSKTTELYGSKAKKAKTTKTLGQFEEYLNNMPDEDSE